MVPKGLRVVFYEYLLDKILESDVFKRILKRIESDLMMSELSDAGKIFTAVDELLLDSEKVLEAFPEVWEMLREDFLEEARSRSANVKSWFSKALLWDVPMWFDSWMVDLRSGLFEAIKRRYKRE